MTIEHCRILGCALFGLVAALCAAYLIEAKVSDSNLVVYMGTFIVAAAATQQGLRHSRSLPLYRAAVCGHRTGRVGKVSVYGQSTVISMPFNESRKTVDWCLSCLADMTIRCGWCKEPIFIGSPVTLYLKPKDFELPEGARLYNHEKSTAPGVVGCLRWECADTGADRQGFWQPPGIVKRVPSPLEMVMSMGAGKGAVIGDLANPNEKPTTFEV